MTSSAQHISISSTSTSIGSMKTARLQYRLEDMDIKNALGKLDKPRVLLLLELIVLTHALMR